MFGSSNTSGFSFGGPTASTAPATSTAFGFGTSTATTGFGAPTTTTASSFGFGANPQTNTGFGSTGFGAPAATGFGNTTAPAFGGFGASTANNAPKFGSTGFGGFGQPTAATSGFGAANTTFSNPQPTLTLTLNQPTTAPATTETTKTSTFVGLGGTQLTTTTEKATENVTKSHLDTTVPPEFMPLVENMKNFIEQQKHIRDENAHEHYYVDSILEIGTAIEDVLKVKLNKIDIDQQRNQKSIEALKRDTNKLLNHGELIHRISRLESANSNNQVGASQSNFINTSTQQFFGEIVDNFRLQMKKYSEEIQSLKSYCESSNDTLFSYEEINQIMRKQHENFVQLASKVYDIHEYANKLRAEASRNKETDSSTVMGGDSMNHSHSNNLAHQGPSPFVVSKNFMMALQK